MWPLLLHDSRRPLDRPPGRTPNTFAAAITDSSQWKLVDTAKDENLRQPYEEVVYFHPFVRKFLYDRPANHPDSEDPEFREGVRLFERVDISSVAVAFYVDDQRPKYELALAVRKVQLFLFDSDVAILVARLTNDGGEPIDLDAVLAFQEVFRRCYPPFWKSTDKNAIAPAGVCPLEVVWYQGETSLGRSNYTDQSDFREFVHRHVQSPVARHFQFLMEPLIPFESRFQKSQIDSAGKSRWLTYRQILDERIPVMSYVAVDDPSRLTEADFFRLTFCDSPGSHPNAFPYSTKSPDVSRFPGDFVYDRYWGSKTRCQAEMAMTTRYLCSGYAFAAVGSTADWDYTSFIRVHMQTHYFKLGLIAHFGRASLLAFDDRLAYAVQDRPSSERVFRERLRLIENDFVTFRTRYWFSEVTNHLQGREIFEWWGKHLEVDSLFQQVEGKIHTVNEVLGRQDAQDLNEKVAKFTEMGISLAIISVLLAILTFGRDIVDAKLPCLEPFVWFIFAVLVLVMMASAVTLWQDMQKCLLRIIGRTTGIDGL